LAGGKRPRLPAPGVQQEEGSRLSLVTALPLSVAQEHLMPFLFVKEAAGLRVVCKALKALVREWPMILGVWPMNREGVAPENLEAALTCFPATEILELQVKEPLPAAEESRIVELLRGHGGTLKRVGGDSEGAKRFFSSAIRAGALPNLTHIDFFLDDPVHLQILSGGMLGPLEIVEVVMTAGEQVGALEHLRSLPHLRSLTLTCKEAHEAAFHPFIPPSLKTLNLKIDPVANLESLLRELPSMVRASGACLEETEFEKHDDFPVECAAALAQVLQACSRTLKTVKLEDRWDGPSSACIRELVPGLLSCRDTIEVLHCHWGIFKALPATCPTFPRLAELNLRGGPYEVLDLASPAWDIMADGRLPALATLYLRHFQELSCGDGEEGGRVARAFEAVAGTLRRLTLLGCVYSLQDGAPYKLGTAIGKLRRLRYLYLGLFENAWDYTDVARGLAASGGCPELFQLRLMAIKSNFDLLPHEPSLILPSVRDLWLGGDCTNDDACLMWCALVQADYRYRLSTWLLKSRRPMDAPVRACQLAILSRGGINVCEDLL
jgi:hypothetical protein